LSLRAGKLIPFLFWSLTAFGQDLTQSPSFPGFDLGPVPGSMDLRNMVRTYLVRQACDLLESGRQRRLRAFANNRWQEWQEQVRQVIREEMGDMPFGVRGGPLNLRKISRHEQLYFDVENILFESFPGWDVNGSLFLPKKKRYPPPWPAVVIPVGHSSKTRANYQIPAQIFAASGYAAILFDPPGMAGEKQGRNDHFNDGVRCYLTGTSSNRYFVLDALRCIDYLQSRTDIETRNGFAMTGVSGGGTTTLYAALLDDRIRALGPACCALPSRDHPILDGYAPCTETLPFAHYKNGIDDTDLLCAVLPTPMRFMYGEKDEVFKLEYSENIAAAASMAYAQAGAADKFSVVADTCGHAYSNLMARQFVQWMDRWIAKRTRHRAVVLDESEFKILPDSMLLCHPRQDATIFSLNRQLADGLKGKRKSMDVRQAVRVVIGSESRPLLPPDKRNKPVRVWAHFLQELLLEVEPGIELPATLLYPVASAPRNGAMLFFDDRGRWTELRQESILAEVAHFLHVEGPSASVMTVDLRGWGDSRPAAVPYEIAGWGHASRWIAYVSAAIGDPILAMRVRDGLSSLAYLRSRTEIDPRRIIVAGYGMGGIVAQHIAALEDSLAGLLSINSLATFESLARSERYLWSHEAFLPNVLCYYDLPELVAGLQFPALLVNSLDAEQKMLTQKAQAEVFDLAAVRNDLLHILQTDQPVIEIKRWAEKILYGRF